MKNPAAVQLGSIKTEKKAQAAREVGKLHGGRPKGSKDKMPRQRRSKKENAP